MYVTLCLYLSTCEIYLCISQKIPINFGHFPKLLFNVQYFEFSYTVLVQMYKCMYVCNIVYMYIFKQLVLFIFFKQFSFLSFLFFDIKINKSVYIIYKSSCYWLNILYIQNYLRLYVFILLKFSIIFRIY